MSMDDPRAGPGGDASTDDLMERLQAGDAEALTALLRLYWRRLEEYAISLLDNADAAEDVVQEAFVRLWERRARWNPASSAGALLYRITRNLALNEQRHARIRSAWRERSQVLPIERRTLPDEATECDELELAVRRAIASLPARRREVFRLARFHGLGYAAIADVMGISPQTVANHMSAAIADLRTALAPFLESPDSE